MFRGQFTHSVDAKGRISLPARFREQLLAGGDPRCILTPAPFDKCLHVYPMRTWEQFEERMATQPRLDPTMARFRRMYMSAAVECELDKAGRVLVPPELRQKVQLEKEQEGVWAGMGEILELWAKHNFEAAMQLSSPEDEAALRALVEQIKL